ESQRPEDRRHFFGSRLRFRLVELPGLDIPELDENSIRIGDVEADVHGLGRGAPLLELRLKARRIEAFDARTKMVHAAGLFRARGPDGGITSTQHKVAPLAGAGFQHVVSKDTAVESDRLLDVGDKDGYMIQASNAHQKVLRAGARGRQRGQASQEFPAVESPDLVKVHVFLHATDDKVTTSPTTRAKLLVVETNGKPSARTT